MKTEIKKTMVKASIVLCVVLISYYFTDKYLILNKTQTTYGIYDFGPIQINATVEVEGTGEQIIDNRRVKTKLKIQKVISSNDQLSLKQGDEITVNEYFVVINNRSLSPIPLMPGISVVGMGTNYKRLNKNETGIVNLHYDNQFKSIWIVPSSIAKK